MALWSLPVVCVFRVEKQRVKGIGGESIPCQVLSGSSSPITGNDLVTNWPESSLFSPRTDKRLGPKEWLTQRHPGTGGKVRLDLSLPRGSESTVSSATPWTYPNLVLSTRWPWPPSSWGLCAYSPFGQSVGWCVAPMKCKLSINPEECQVAMFLDILIIVLEIYLKETM